MNITLSLEACTVLSQKLTEMGVKLPETYLYWDGQKGHSGTFEIKLEVNYRRAKELDSYMTPAITFSELITDWLPLLEQQGNGFLWSLPKTQQFSEELWAGGMPAVSTRVIELVKDLPR